MITKNFQLNSLANQFAAAVYDSVRQQNGGGWFPMNVGGNRIEVAITDGVKSIRELVDSYALEVMRGNYLPHQWESIGIQYLKRCVDADGLTDAGRQAWANMIADMGETLDAGGFNEKH